MFPTYPIRVRFVNIIFISDTRFWQIQISIFHILNICIHISIRKLKAYTDIINAISNLYPIHLHPQPQCTLPRVYGLSEISRLWSMATFQLRTFGLKLQTLMFVHLCAEPRLLQHTMLNDLRHCAVTTRCKNHFLKQKVNCNHLYWLLANLIEIKSCHLAFQW